MWIALNAFKDLTRSDNIGPFDFITFWTSGYERHRPPATLQDAALQVIIALTGIAAAQWLLRKSGVEIGISSELHDLIMDAQLEISKLKAVTPQEMADSLTEASRSLETALARTGSSMDSIGAFSKELSTVTTGLQAVTQSLDQSATRVERAVEPLMALPHILSQTVTSVAGITERLSEARAQMDSTSDNAYRLAEITYELINKTSGVLNELDAVTRRINIAGETSDRFITTMSAAAEISKELADVVDNYSPHILALREIAEKFRMTTNSLDVISQSFEASANLYKNTNETQPKGD
jgi:ABC-type transporter Mla subunit MlaD